MKNNLVLEPAEVKEKEPRKTPLGYQNLLIRDFPVELMDRCKLYSGDSCGTRAVLNSLRKLFAVLDDYKELQIRYNDAVSDLADFKLLFYDELQLAERKRKFLQEKVPGRFQLHGGEIK